MSYDYHEMADAVNDTDSWQVMQFIDYRLGNRGQSRYVSHLQYLPQMKCAQLVPVSRNMQRKVTETVELNCLLNHLNQLFSRVHKD